MLGNSLIAPKFPSITEKSMCGKSGQEDVKVGKEFPMTESSVSRMMPQT